LGKSFGRILSFLAMMDACSITFSSSRTFPGTNGQGRVPSLQSQYSLPPFPVTADFLQEIGSEQGDVILPLSEGRDKDGDDIEPIIEVFTKRSFLISSIKFLFVAAITRTSTSNVSSPRLFRIGDPEAHEEEGSALEGKPHQSHRERCPSVGQFKPSDLSPNCSGKAPFS